MGQTQPASGPEEKINLPLHIRFIYRSPSLPPYLPLRMGRLDPFPSGRLLQASWGEPSLLAPPLLLSH